MQLVLPYDIVNNTPADAIPVETNYNVIAEFTNSQVINRDGTVSMDAPLLLKGDPTAPNHAVNMGFLEGFLPVGVIMPFGGVAAPAGNWLLCDGSAKSTTTYPTLFNVLGYRYGGSGGTFNVPDMKGRFPIGKDTAQTEFSEVGKKGGTFTVPVPLHSHTMAHTHEHVHTHTIAHTHTVDPAQLNTGTPGSHSHLIAANNMGTTPNTGNLARSAGGTATTFPTDTEAAHVHTVNIPSTTTSASSAASSGAASDATSGQPSAASTANAGTSGVEMQPPFTVVSYIIRAA